MANEVKMPMTPTDLDRKAEELAGPHDTSCTRLHEGNPCDCGNLTREALIRATLGEMQEEIERLKEAFGIAQAAAVLVRIEAEKQHERAEAAEAKCVELEKERCHHGWRGVRAERISTPCPTCHAESLFIGSGGHLTCSVLGCKNPSPELAWSQAHERGRAEGIEACVEATGYTYLRSLIETK